MSLTQVQKRVFTVTSVLSSPLLEDLEDLVVTVWIVPTVTNSHGFLFVILVTVKTIMYYFEIKFFES